MKDTDGEWNETTINPKKYFTPNWTHGLGKEKVKIKIIT